MATAIKYYKPEDFSKPSVSIFRMELVDIVNGLFAEKKYTMSEDGKTITIIMINVKYTPEHLLDFCNHYCLNGGWKSVQHRYKTSQSDGMIYIDFKRQ